MFAGECWNPAATNIDTAKNTGMYFPMIVRPIVAKNAAIPTSQLAKIPDRISLDQPSTPPMTRKDILVSTTSASSDSTSPVGGWAIAISQPMVTAPIRLPSNASDQNRKTRRADDAPSSNVAGIHHIRLGEQSRLRENNEEEPDAEAKALNHEPCPWRLKPGTQQNREQRSDRDEGTAHRCQHQDLENAQPIDAVMAEVRQLLDDLISRYVLRGR